MQLPTPVATPSPPPALTEAKTPDLAVRINAATRQQHMELNRLIVDRLPLCLPPATRDLAVYGIGLSAFAQIFFAFESKWRSLEAVENFHNEASEGHKRDIEAWLAKLRPQGLARSRRLRADLMYVEQRSRKLHSAPGLSRDYVKSLHVKATEKPHILVAYSWVMYMATFSGGRWIRQQLNKADHEFWNGQAAAGSNDDVTMDVPSPAGFSFLSFDGTQDGEDIKAAFKTNLAQADRLLSETEKQDVVFEAQEIFSTCIEMVKELDGAAMRLQQTPPWWPIATAVLLAVLAAILAIQWR